MARSSTIAGLALGALALLVPAAPAAAADGDFFPSDDDTLAIFEFSGSVLDSSGNGRNATLLDPASTFIPSAYGSALVLPGVGSGQLQGFDWSAYASLLVPPYTVEVLLYPENLDSWNRLFTNDPTSDDGLYYLNGALQNYPDAPLAGSELPAQSVHCLAWSAPLTPDNVLDLYIDGEYLGQVGRAYDVPSVAWFLVDNTTGSGTGENLDGSVDAMRISSVARTGAELAATCEAAGAGESLIPVAAAPALPATGAGAAGTDASSLIAGSLLAVGIAMLAIGRYRRRSAR
jgi:hypothetical protein